MNVENLEGGRGFTQGQRRIRTLVWEVDKIALTFKIDTQTLREKLIFQLQVLFDMVNQEALNCHPKQWKQKQAWVRMAAYIGQVINSIGNTYDLKAIEQQVAELKKELEGSDLATLLSEITLKEAAGTEGQKEQPPTEKKEGENSETSKEKDT